MALTGHYPYMFAFVSWLLIGQITRQHELLSAVRSACADGNNLTICLYQQAGHLGSGSLYCAVAAEHSIQLAV